MSGDGATTPRRARPHCSGPAVLGLVTLSLLLMPPARADPQQDARTVACLAPDRVADLIRAAVALRLAATNDSPDELTLADGQVVSVTEWRQRAPADFTRACTALTTPITASSAAARPATGTLQTLLPSFGSAFFGALIGSVVGFFNGAATRRRERSGRVQTTGLEFRQAADAYLDARQKQPDEVNLRGAQLNHARNEAVAVLDQVSAQYPGWDRPAGLRRTLTGPVLGPALASHWPTELAERDRRMTAARVELEAASQEFAGIALGVSRWRKTYRTPTGATGSGSATPSGSATASGGGP